MDEAVLERLVELITAALAQRSGRWSVVGCKEFRLPSGWRMWRTTLDGGLVAAVVLVVHDMADEIQVEARWSRVGESGLADPPTRWPDDDLLAGDSAAVRTQVLMGRRLDVLDLAELAERDPAAQGLPLMDPDDEGPALRHAARWVTDRVERAVLPYLQHVDDPVPD